MSRIFLIGNGASLKETPLDLLKGEATMGVNKIGKIFSPTYYVKVDYSQFDGNEWKDEVTQNQIQEIKRVEIIEKKRDE